MRVSAKRCARHVIVVVCAMLMAGTAAAVDKREVIKQARSAYYSLESQGFGDLQCNLSPNWEALLEDARKTDPAGTQRAIQTLKQLQFSVSFGVTGSAKVTHTTVTAANPQMAEGLSQIYQGMEQMVTGFFDTWSPFMRTPPFPEVGGRFDLADQGEQWAVSYKEGSTAVVTTMGKDFAVRELKVETPEFVSSLRPQFTRSPKGFLLTSYEAELHGKMKSEGTRLKAGIAYQQVDGFQLPKTLDLSGSYGDTPFQIQVTFLGCKATKRP